jgi:hypothetical protein
MDDMPQGGCNETVFPICTGQVKREHIFTFSTYGTTLCESAPKAIKQWIISCSTAQRLTQKEKS